MKLENAFNQIKESVDKFKKATIAATGIAVGVSAGLNNAGAAETKINKDNNTKQAGVEVEIKSETIDSKTYVVGNKEVNEANEKIKKLEIAKEAIANAGKGPFMSEQMKSYVLIAEEKEPVFNGNYFNHSFQLLAYKVTKELESGHPICNISMNGAEGDNDNDLLNDLNTRGYDSGVKISFDKHPTNPLDLAYVFNKLQEMKMSPLEISALFQKINPEITKEVLIAALEKPEYPIRDRKELAEVIALLKQGLDSDSENLAAK